MYEYKFVEADLGGFSVANHRQLMRSMQKWLEISSSPCL